MTDNGANEPGTARVEFAHEWKRLVASTGSSQSELAQRLDISDSQMSRYVQAKNVPMKDSTISALCEIANVTTNELQRLLKLAERARQESGGLKARKPEEGGTSSNDMNYGRSEEVAASADEPRRWAKGRAGFMRLIRRPFVIFLLGIIVVAVPAILIWRSEVGVSGRSDPRPPTDPANQGIDSCDQYEVTAADLWLRNEYGSTQFEIRRGQKVTVESRTNSHGLPYWLVVTEDHRQGWADHRYLRSLCDTGSTP